jgi:hypothetical protein
MTTSADILWTPEAWARRLVSGNPVYPFEWELHYQDGRRFKRVCLGEIRTTGAAPRRGVLRLRVLGGPTSVLDVEPASPKPDRVVCTARVVGVLGVPGRGGVAGYRFGFQHGDAFVGVELDGTGRVVRHAATSPNL